VDKYPTHINLIEMRVISALINIQYIFSW